MKTSTITKTLGVLALLGSSAGMAATVNITASTLTPNVGDSFTLTITGDVPNTFAGTMALAFDSAKVAYVSGVSLAPWNVFTKNSAASVTPTVFDVETPSATASPSPVYDIARLTFTALAAGAASIVINDDGGNQSGFFDATAEGAPYIPVTYNQANVIVQGAVVPAPATLGLLATGIAGLVLRRKRAAA